MKGFFFFIGFLLVIGNVTSAAQKHDYVADRTRFNAGRNAVRHCATTLWSNYGVCEYRALWHPRDVLLDDVPDEMEAGAKYEGMIYALSVFRKEVGKNGIKTGEIMLLYNANVIARYIMQFNPEDLSGRNFATRFGLIYTEFRDIFLAAGKQDMCIRDKGITTGIANCRPIEKIYDIMLSESR